MIAAVLIAIGGLQSANAAIVWSGSGETGTDPFGSRWLINNSDTAPLGQAIFGMPGSGAGLTTYGGSETVFGVEFEFLDLPDGVTLANPENFLFAMNVDPFAAADLWDFTFPSATTVRFTPPTPDRTLDPGERFFAVASFSDDVDFSRVNFRATYYTTAIPEPSSLIPLALIGCMSLNRKRRARRQVYVQKAA